MEMQDKYCKIFPTEPGSNLSSRLSASLMRLTVGKAMRMREYAVHADYAHICKYADEDENLIHIIHI